MTNRGLCKRIVLTGGPCGGKSTAQAMLSDVFSNMGWKVYRVPETATVLLSGGVNFAEYSAEQALQFQKDLLCTMHKIEDTFFNLALHDAERGCNVLVICDRGSMDASAYIDKAGWNSILSDLNLSEIAIRDERYDYVIHLVTAAIGAEQFYSKESNSIRSEGIALARKLDLACMNGWMGHPYFDIIDNSTNFEQKCKRVISTVLERFGLEDRRYGKNIQKFKFKVCDSFSIDDHFPIDYQDFMVEHTILSITDEQQTRIRRRTQNGISHFNITKTGAAVDEVRRSLSGREYDSLKEQADQQYVPIVKKRRCFLFDNQYFQLDLFQSPSQGLMILEAYLPYSSGANISTHLPPFIPVEMEITGNKHYSLSHLSKKK